MPAVRTPAHSTLSGSLSSTEKREEAWQFCAATIERSYDEQLKRWNAELDMLLVFAGLFSAALTAFNVQSYLLLQPDNTDTIVLALVGISAQLESFSTSTSFVNSTRPAFSLPDTSLFKPPTYAVWMNALWFSSLTCTLSASSIAVMVKQWLHQYGQGLSGNSVDMAHLRQYRSESLLKWHVPSIIAALPILLQAALALFLAGLLILLYTLHQAVAVSVSILVGGLILFTTATTVLPVYFSDCCYQSPQALSICLSVQAGRQVIIKLLDVFQRKSGPWINEAGCVHHAVRSALSVLETKASFRSWQSREKPDVDERHEELEQAVALTTYRIVSDNAVLTSTVVPCLSGVGALTERMSVKYGELLVATVDKLKRADWTTWRPAMPFILVVLSLIVKEPRPGAVRKVLSILPENRLGSAKSNLGMLFAFSMTNLVANGIEARAAFEVILRYLRDAKVGEETVEAAFPRKWDVLDDLIDLDSHVAISNYLSGIEHVVRYLLRQRATLGELLLPVDERVVTMLIGFRCFLTCPAWSRSVCRKHNVVWALIDSRLPELIWKLRGTGSTPTALEEAARKSMSVFQSVSGDLLRGCLDGASGHGPMRASSLVTRQALERLKAQIERYSNDGSTTVQKPSPKDSSAQTAADGGISCGETAIVKPSHQSKQSLRLDTDPLGAQHSGLPTPVPDPELAAEAEMDVADISYILDMGIYWDEMPHTPGVDTTRLSEVAMLSPALCEGDGTRADPVLPSVAEVDFTSSSNAHTAAGTPSDDIRTGYVRDGR